PRVDLARWIDQPGLPVEAVPPTSPALDEVDAIARAFVAGASIEAMAARAWTVFEWRHLLGTLLRAELAHERLALLDETFALSSSGNAEILFAWLRIGARRHWEPALRPIELFLGRTGRG